MSFRLVDLSHPVAPGMPVYPGDPAVTFAPAADLATEGCRLLRLTLGTHTGTHLDAPAHMLEQGATLDALPAARLAGPGLCLDVCGRTDITPEDLAPVVGRLPPGGWLLLHTGWDARWGQAEYFAGRPGLTPEAANGLAREAVAAGLAGVGVDTPSVDVKSRPDHPVHLALLGAGLCIAENLRGLEALPERDFTFLCLPPALVGTDGAPARAVALIPE